jgi:starch synthase
MPDPGRLLFVASEVYPLVKTGGLADVAGCLPSVLQDMGLDVRILLPGYRDVLEKTDQAAEIARFEVAGTELGVVESTLPGTRVRTWLLVHPLFSERSGNPYHDDQGIPWVDNAERFMLLSRLAAAIANGETPLEWRPDVLHCNDWHTGPAIALAHQGESCPRTVFTIHNLAHMGMFDRASFERLQLPEHLWSGEGLEFYGQLCFIKGGLAFADWVTTVSPTYAEEICREPGGMGLEGLLSHRRDHLVGILNGIDEDVWNPATDSLLVENYDIDSLDKKQANKKALLDEMKLDYSEGVPLFGFVGRLAEQKGLDLLLPVLDDLLRTPAQLVVLGTGDPRLEQALQEVAARHPGSVALTLAYSESLAHRIEAASDVFLMPSLFEPCGLNQLYSLRYGTLPLVRAVGGLADTVVDASDENLADGSATGFVFSQPDSRALSGAVQRALDLWNKPSVWAKMQRAAMRQDFSWQRSAQNYLELYGLGQ